MALEEINTRSCFYRYFTKLKVEILGVFLPPGPKPGLCSGHAQRLFKYPAELGMPKASDFFKNCLSDNNSKLIMNCKQWIKNHFVQIIYKVWNQVKTKSKLSVRAVLKFWRNCLVWAVFIGDLTSWLIIVAGCINHQKRNNWVGVFNY